MQQAIVIQGNNAELVKVQDIEKIARYGVLMLPALVVDGVVVAQGNIPNMEEINKLVR